MTETRAYRRRSRWQLEKNIIGRMLVAANRMLIRFSRGLFAYQIFMRIKPRPSLEPLLRIPREQSRIRASNLGTTGIDAV
jgi:hypothetical protein